jgi:2-polyprenyl-3-methyl-5-hydroxy-6-metoxy-1,4-benzoquinol methylase
MLGLKYFEQNTSKIRKITNRQELGEREIITFLNISEFYGKKISLSDEKKQFLDLGCGDQHLRKSVEDRNMNYLGLDITDVNFEFDKLPLENNSIDFIVTLAVIEHISNPDNFLSEILRVLKPGGIIYISTPNWYYSYKEFYNDPTHVKPYNPATLERILLMYGFNNPKTYPGLRCKPKWYYLGNYRFFKGNYLLPFRGETKYVPKFLKGRSTSIFAIATK